MIPARASSASLAVSRLARMMESIRRFLAALQKAMSDGEVLAAVAEAVKLGAPAPTPADLVAGRHRSGRDRGAPAGPDRGNDVELQEPVLYAEERQLVPSLRPQRRAGRPRAVIEA